MKSKRSRRAALILAVAALVLDPVSPVQAEDPMLLYTTSGLTYQGGPTWVSADAALNSEGQINEELFPGATARRIRSVLETPESPMMECIPVGELYMSIVNPDPRSTLEQAIEHSPLIAWLEIVEVHHGFHWGLASSLLTARVDEVVKGSADHKIYYLPFPVARFDVGKHRICKSDKRFASLPQPGDRILLLLPSGPAQSEEFLDIYEPTSYVSVSGGSVSYPKAFIDSIEEAKGPALPETEVSLRRTLSELLETQEP